MTALTRPLGQPLALQNPNGAAAGPGFGSGTPLRASCLPSGINWPLARSISGRAADRITAGGIGVAAEMVNRGAALAMPKPDFGSASGGGRMELQPAREEPQSN
jgi:hypothetical protein